MFTPKFGENDPVELREKIFFVGGLVKNHLSQTVQGTPRFQHSSFLVVGFTTMERLKNHAVRDVFP